MRAAGFSPLHPSDSASEAYHQRGERQLTDYQDVDSARRGYLLSFHFKKDKKAGIKEIVCGGRRAMEIVV